MKLTFLLGHFDWNMWVEAGEYYWGYPQTKTNIRLYRVSKKNATEIQQAVVHHKRG
jgi:hypothetical protein